MRKYGEERYDAQAFSLHYTDVERRDQWVDVHLQLRLEEGEALPEGLVSPSVLVICVPEGDVVQIVLLDEGCDSEFQFTPEEEARIKTYVHEQISALIHTV